MTPPTPGEYPGLTMGDYLRTRAIGSGVIKAIVERCPAAAFHESYLNPHRAPDPSPASDAGGLAHALVLEDCDDRVELIDPREYPAKSSGNIPDGWGNKAIRCARDDARASGKIPVLLPQWETIKAMANSARAFIASLRTTEPAIWRSFQPDGGTSELTALWEDGPTLCRLRTDRIGTDRDIVTDLKFVTQGAEPDAFTRNGLLRMQYAISAGFYRRGLYRLHKVAAQYFWLVVEQDPPHLCSLVGLTPAFTAWTDARTARGLRSWQACVEADKFPGYPNRVCYAELPPWELQKLEQEELENPWGGGALDYAKLTSKEVA